MSLPPTKQRENPVLALGTFFSVPVVFLKLASRSKMPVGKWRHLRVEDMTATYKSKLEGGNIGVALGDVSNGICAIDIDNDKHVEPFLDRKSTRLNSSHLGISYA